MKKELRREKESEEAKLRAEQSRELDQLRDRLEGEEKAEERKAMEKVHKEKMEALRQEGEQELQQRREALDKKRKNDVEVLLREKAKEHEDVSCACHFFPIFTKHTQPKRHWKRRARKWRKD